jgi:hypothetical protein
MLNWLTGWSVIVLVHATGKRELQSSLSNQRILTGAGEHIDQGIHHHKNAGGGIVVQGSYSAEELNDYN